MIHAVSGKGRVEECLLELDMDTGRCRIAPLPGMGAVSYTHLFEKVLGIFADYLDADETTEVYISRHGCVRVEFDQNFHYCTGEVCHLSLIHI